MDLMSKAHRDSVTFGQEAASPVEGSVFMP